MKTAKTILHGIAATACGALLLSLAACTEETATAAPDAAPQSDSAAKKQSTSAKLPIPDESVRPANAGVATFAAGCFWCVEEVFHQVDGVSSVVSGYMGGTADSATYKLVSAGKTDHAEAVQVIYDKDTVTYGELVEWFWKLHDPTQVNRQGPDYGRQYRSAIFYHDDEQKQVALASKEKLEASGKLNKPVATEIVPAMEFYDAEAYHQNYARLHPNDGYIRQQLVPKLKKLGLVVPK